MATITAMAAALAPPIALSAPADTNGKLKNDPRMTPTVKAVSRVLPSVVNIGTERIISAGFSPWQGADPFEKLFRNFFRQQPGVKTLSLGSGAIVAKGGLIVTNAHVVHKATKILVRTSDGKTHLAKEVASDPLNDIALLRLTDANSANLPPIPLAEPGSLLLGETVVAVGNPYGLGNSISRGVLSATGREVSYNGKVLFSDILQTDAAINPGNSGGPLININGEMIGINTAIFQQADGIGFAIPIKRLESILARWMIPERFRNVSLGIIPAETGGNGKIKLEIASVFPDSPAWNAGVRKGDVVLAIDGEKSPSLMKTSDRLWRMKAGNSITLDIKDKGRITVKAREIKALDGKELARNRLALGTQLLTQKLARALEYPFHGGLVVDEILFKNPHIRRGDILVRIDNIPIYDYTCLRRALENKRNGHVVNAFFISLKKQGGKLLISRKVVPITLR
jgi:serine protease Do